jgi:hypothetical protein
MSLLVKQKLGYEEKFTPSHLSLLSPFVQLFDSCRIVFVRNHRCESEWPTGPCRKLNFETGSYSDALLYGVNRKQVAFDATSKKQIDASTFTNGGYQPFSTGVAAIAFDKKITDCIIPMFIDQLRYIDLKTMTVYYVTDQPLAGQTNNNNDNAKVISRMVIAPDGYGYAITNDATSFIRFSTGKD